MRVHKGGVGQSSARESKNLLGAKSVAPAAPGLAERGRAALWRGRERRRGRAGAPGAARVRRGAVALGA